jgi:hypothetical protein
MVSLKKPIVRTYLNIDFKCVISLFNFLNEVENSIALTANIYLITNAFGGRKVFLFPRTLVYEYELRVLQLVSFRDWLSRAVYSPELYSRRQGTWHFGGFFLWIAELSTISE